MKSLILAFAIWMAANNSAGSGGNLQDNVPADLTDCCGGVLYAR